ncbi:uncharacterized protein MONBRDRAFT_39165 [Monosiga brevicollis MX1]|uniref:DNA-directed RNA polymerase subunit n=1 Tax=Monosiga brevicollis TaxID=81824 RepID=A9VCM2_MONBE|nr:uncharacterized protein MONBRDRAFT_39165 [Monosiga brevicollis MX1]EDQ84710.1 predicted protein [Monosiga brevicollis MX1]|eukprot:XP_001750496.1 hypothetical protein [Monosiga brevicollis MX1]
MAKQQYRDDQTPKKISHIQFGLMDHYEMQRLSEVRVYSKEFYTGLPDRKPAPFGPLDRRLGAFDKSLDCATCSQNLRKCEGHFGHIELELPVFHVGFFKATLSCLQRICKSCSRVMLSHKQATVFLRRLQDPNLERGPRAAIIKEVGDQCRKNAASCPHCSACNGVVKRPKNSVLRIVHERFTKKNNRLREAHHQLFQEAASEVKDLSASLKADKVQDELNPLRALQLLRAVPDQDCPLLDMDPFCGRPEKLILTNLIVPPGGSGSNEDPLTTGLAAKRVEDAGGQKIERIMQTWEALQVHVALYFNGDLPGLPKDLKPKKAPRGFYQRLKGKQGRFRGNLSGKRVNYSGRTVISPDPNASIDEVCVPYHVCKILTYPEMVNDYNIQRLRAAVENGPDNYPGAVLLEKSRDKRTYDLAHCNRQKSARELAKGDIVRRHLIDGDYALFNRQPSLHRMSIMCHRVKARPWRTFRFNECVCKPYNADFDGDEMNLHVPQTEEAKAEAALLLRTTHNLCTPCNGEPLIAACQDFITGCFLISQKDTFFTKAKVMQMVCAFSDGSLKISLPVPAIVKPVAMWTGKQVFSMMMRPSKDDPHQVDLTEKNKSFDKNYEKSEVKKLGRDLTIGERSLCPEDGFVIIRSSRLLCGFLDKANVGESKSTIFYRLLRDYSAQAAVDGMLRMTKLTTRYLMERGFSIGLEDVTPPQELTDEKAVLIKTAFDKCSGYIAEYKSGRIECQPGQSAEETLESFIRKDLNQVREEAGSLCRKVLSPYNAPKIMAKCGSKGSPINMAQMIALVGQQILNGSRVPNGFEDRPLPHFRRFAKVPMAKGFVANSFYTGLTPAEFFFHTMSGREGLVDTAVKTAETGYMQRRLMKALEDLVVHYDTTVRNSSGHMIQFCYGDDGLDPQGMETDDCAVDLEHLFVHVLASDRDGPPPVTLQPAAVISTFESILKEQDLRDYDHPYCPLGLDVSADKEHFFLNQLRVFLEKRAQQLAEIRQRIGLAPALEAPAEDDPAKRHLVNNLMSVTREDMRIFVEKALFKFRRTVVEPGTAVGAIGAQSIGEPGTQMTLKTFHFAGVAAMNVTLGVPRIKEIINAAKNISTPVITAKLENDREESFARQVKARLETLTLGEVADHFDVVCNEDGGYVRVKLNLKVIQRKHLEVTMNTIIDSIAASRLTKIKHEHLSVMSSEVFQAVPVCDSKTVANRVHALRHLANVLPNCVITGLPGIRRAIIAKDPNEGTFSIAIDGTDLKGVMATPGVIGTTVDCNHVMELEQTLGIEAARSIIMDQVQYVMSNYGIHINPRHTMLMSDLMTFKGEVLGITRFGIAKMKESVFMLASFEKTTDHLFDAALRGTTDSVDGVSECIILGVPMRIGTGLFKLLHETKVEEQPKRRPLLFDQEQFHPSLPKRSQ